MKVVYRVLSLLLALCFLCSCLISCGESSTEEEQKQEQEPTPEPSYEEFGMTAQEFLDTMTVGINLGNTLDSFYLKYFGCETAVSNPDKYETVFKNPMAKSQVFEAIKDLGFNVVRIPVTWFPHMDPTTYEVYEKWMTRVKQVVDKALDEDLIVIINVHHDTASDCWLSLDNADFEETKGIFENLWGQIAETFKDYGENLVFEGFNEIYSSVEGSQYTSEVASANLNALNQAFVDTVRASGGNNAKRYLVCSTYFTRCSPMIIDSYKVPTDTIANHIITQVHNYSTKETQYYYAMDYLYEHLVQKGYPVFIGECGLCFSTTYTTEEKVAWATSFVEKACECGIRVCLWDSGDGGDYQYMDRENATCKQPELVAAMIEARANADPCDMLPLYKGRTIGENLASDYTWRFYGDGSCTNTESGVNIHVNTPGTLLWSAQVFTTNVTLAQGKGYRLSFDYTMDSGIDVPLMIQKSTNNTIFNGVLHSTETTEHFEMDFWLYDLSMENYTLILYLGGPYAEPNYDLIISNFSIYEVE